MVGGSSVNAKDDAVATLSFDQAIFTSIRSPMGEGYRIVAASKGVTPDEKREIVQCAPSHGSLSSTLNEATGMACFTLNGGRQCVFLSRTAGIEHTARGGFRVFTHVCLFDPPVFRRLSCDLFAIEDALRECFDDQQMKKPPMCLEQGRIALNETRAERGAAPSDRDLGHAARILAAVLAERRLLVVGARCARDVLSAVVGALPAYTRRRWSLSYGLKYSPGRRFDLMFTEATNIEQTRILRDHDVTAINWSDQPLQVDSPYEDWVSFVERGWKTGRTASASQICAGLTETCDPVVLACLARLSEDLEHVAEADRSLLREIERRHAGESVSIELHQRMLADLRKATERRRWQIDVEEQADAEAEEDAILGLA